MATPTPVTPAATPTDVETTDPVHTWFLLDRSS